MWLEYVKCYINGMPYSEHGFIHSDNASSVHVSSEGIVMLIDKYEYLLNLEWLKDQTGVNDKDSLLRLLIGCIVAKEEYGFASLDEDDINGNKELN